MHTKLTKSLAGTFQQYQTYLEKQPLSEHTKRVYVSRLNQLFDYIGTESKEDYSAFLKDAVCREYALSKYKTHMKRVQKAKPNTVNAILTTIDHFCQFLGLEKPKIKREDLPKLAPKALTAEEQLHLLQAADAARPIDKALVYLMMFTGLRISECLALDRSDVVATARKGR